MKKTIKYLNYFIFIVSLYLVVSLQSYTYFSTSLLSVLAEGDEKKMMESFHKTQSNHTLLVAVKGFDDKALSKMKKIEKELDALTLISQKKSYLNENLQAHQKEYKLLIQDVNETKMSTLEISKTLKNLYTEMTTSFFPITLDKTDPFEILISNKPRELEIKNSHLILGKYGYMSYFTLGSQNLQAHQNLYKNVHEVMQDKKDVMFFSPLFYYVENSEAIRSDVQYIITIAFGILILLYFVILRDILLLIHTFTTLATSAMLAMVVLTQVYSQVSIFVFVFGIAISTVAIDYMFHHYIHGYYKERRKFNREVFFGFLTTFLAFFILSFTSFLLIKQIAFFTMVSLFISYMHFSFLYPFIGFKVFSIEEKKKKKVFCALSPKLLLSISLALILASTIWIHFDFNLKNLDYDNKDLQEKEHFFKSQYASSENIPFVIKADSIDSLITFSKTIQRKVPKALVSLSGLMSEASYEKNKNILIREKALKVGLEIEAQKLGFKKGYFTDAYKVAKPFVLYTEDEIKNYGIEIMKIDNEYITFGTVDKQYYAEVLKYDFIQSLSIKEHFELLMQKSVNRLGLLGLLVIVLIVATLLIIAKDKFTYSLVFLLFPIAMMSLYALFFSINILHLFMLFIILALSIDYAIYMGADNDIRTKKAISYSLISTFSGFGVLVFSQINALFSLGVIAIIGIGSIAILLLCMKKEG